GREGRAAAEPGGLAAAAAAGAVAAAAAAGLPVWYRGLLPPPSLIPLPRLLQSLLLHYADARCSECGSRPAAPCLCLLTGRLLCAPWRGCAGARLHAAEWAGGACLLLNLASSRVMALRGGRMAACQSPYLDAHGDEDVDLRRGRPLYLDAHCYRQLARLWGSAALEFDTQLLHSSRPDVMELL
ncbi:hypothetical protein Agub_g527, partial [Astrephomene gubernaculifera]